MSHTLACLQTTRRCLTLASSSTMVPSFSHSSFYLKSYPPSFPRSHNSGSVSYDDPRLVCTEVLGCDAERVAESTLSTLARRRSSDQDSNDDTDSSLGPRSGRSSVADDSSPPSSPGLTPSDAGDAADTPAPLAADGAQQLPGDAEMAPEQQATPWLVRGKEKRRRRLRTH